MPKVCCGMGLYLHVANRVLQSRYNRDLIAVSGFVIAIFLPAITIKCHDRQKRLIEIYDHDYSIKPPIHLYATH